MRVVIADDSAIVRDGLARLLRDHDIDVRGTAGDATNAIRLATAELPDVVVLDIRMPPSFTDEGLRAAEEIRETLPSVGVLVLSQHIDPGYAMRLLDGHQDRAGYLLKDRVTDIDSILNALKRIEAGETAIDQQLVAELIELRHQARPLHDLSPREREVLALMAEGLTDRAIAQRLWLSQKTIETHIRHVLRKLNLPPDTSYNRRVQAVLAYLQAL